jgi:hypothetical protein
MFFFFRFGYHIVQCWVTGGRQLYLLGVQNTPLNLLHWFISHSTSRYYNLSSYTEFWPSDILSRSGPLMSSPSECWQLTDWLPLSNWLTIHLLADFS